MFVQGAKTEWIVSSGGFVSALRKDLRAHHLAQRARTEGGDCGWKDVSKVNGRDS